MRESFTKAYRDDFAIPPKANHSPGRGCGQTYSSSFKSPPRNAARIHPSDHHRRLNILLGRRRRAPLHLDRIRQVRNRRVLLPSTATMLPSLSRRYIPASHISPVSKRRNRKLSPPSS